MQSPSIATLQAIRISAPGSVFPQRRISTQLIEDGRNPLKSDVTVYINYDNSIARKLTKRAERKNLALAKFHQSHEIIRG